ncbi:MAG: glycosyltransferase family 4 protein [Candidatus Eisenbacteria bacterium]|uniref:Glycosyltransferase family 4 protein n=1 Tax=Eiseniibacteriota bacterium TaxID=2212470 RepID=A0A538TKV0_UNCEI|nr:MAG: glycosyltransferase family 4 protein [Candidatus Eisenbacteria bacterium]
MTDRRGPAIWISWERHRRSRELARALSVPLYEIVSRRGGRLRSIDCALRTTGLLLRVRPSLLFVQNPSIQLAALASFLKPVFGYTLVVDRHSNFDFSNTRDGLFNRLSNYGLRIADLTIVTNEAVQRLVEEKGGRGIILQDLLPKLNAKRGAPHAGPLRVVYVCSFSPDEPVEEVLEAAVRLDKNVHVYVTGRVPGAFQSRAQRAPATITFTGFLPEDEYLDLLGSADVVMALTKREHTLLCGAYEGVSLHKPLVLSNQEALRNYFTKGVVLTENTPEAIATAIRKAVEDRERLSEELSELVPVLKADWSSRFRRLKSHLGVGDGTD